MVMKDPEVIELRNKFLLTIGIIALFTIPLFLVIKNKLIIGDSKILKKIESNDNIFLLITENNCNNCNMYKKILKDENINYIELNRDKERSYKSILKSIDMSINDINPPTIIYLENGKNISFLPKTKKEEDIRLYIKSSLENNTEWEE